MADRWLGNFLQKAHDLGVMENTLLVVISDHGHALGEHGYLGKPPRALWPELTDIVLFVRHPEGKRSGEESDYYSPRPTTWRPQCSASWASSLPGLWTAKTSLHSLKKENPSRGITSPWSTAPSSVVETSSTYWSAATTEQVPGSTISEPIRCRLGTS
jgi:Sulfatase